MKLIKEEAYTGSKVKCKYCKKDISAFSIFRHEKECVKEYRKVNER